MAPLFEYSSVRRLRETPYIKLVTQLFGDRALVANATGRAGSISEGILLDDARHRRLPRVPPGVANLLEDDAEFGLGFRLAVDTAADRARLLVAELAPRIGDDLRDHAVPGRELTRGIEIARQRERVEILRSRLASLSDPRARSLLSVADYLVGKSIWIVGGDGWAYDIGYGGLDHVLALGRDVNVLVLDTGVYSNTGGQASKATPLGASARFAARGKETPRKDLGLMAMAYGHVYVAQVALGANDAQTLRAIAEAESYHGASLLIAYSACIAHGFEMGALDHQKLAVASGFWPLYRYDPRRSARGETPLQIDSKPPTIPFDEYARSETRFRALAQSDPERARVLIARAQADVTARMALYQRSRAPVSCQGRGRRHEWERTGSRRCATPASPSPRRSWEATSGR
ncbi:MAG: thiamine pyrophosphate-dependent enzyme [Acidobacteriota bacterium]